MTRTRRISLSLASLAGLSALVMASGIAVAADGLSVSMDQGRIVALKTPFKSVYVGNSIIADATVVDPTHFVVLGKNFGTTNVIAVDADGREVANMMITVMTQGGKMVTLQRGPDWKTLACNSGRCESRPTPGDEVARYNADTDAINKREGQSVGAASVPNPP